MSINGHMTTNKTFNPSESFTLIIFIFKLLIYLKFYDFIIYSNPLHFPNKSWLRSYNVQTYIKNQIITKNMDYYKDWIARIALIAIHLSEQTLHFMALFSHFLLVFVCMLGLSDFQRQANTGLVSDPEDRLSIRCLTWTRKKLTATGSMQSTTVSVLKKSLKYTRLKSNASQNEVDTVAVCMCTCYVHKYVTSRLMADAGLQVRFTWLSLCFRKSVVSNMIHRVFEGRSFVHLSIVIILHWTLF